jgi:hypothetical protein
MSRVRISSVQTLVRQLYEAVTRCQTVWGAKQLLATTALQATANAWLELGFARGPHLGPLGSYALFNDKFESRLSRRWQERLAALEDLFALMLDAVRSLIDALITVVEHLAQPAADAPASSSHAPVFKSASCERFGMFCIATCGIRVVCIGAQMV